MVSTIPITCTQKIQDRTRKHTEKAEQRNGDTITRSANNSSLS